MKKTIYFLLTISLILGLTSCSSDNKEDDITPPEPEYFNPVEGEWLKEKQNTVKAIFTNDFYWKTELFENGKWGNTSIVGKYKIDDKSIKLTNVTPLEYKLDGGKLSIYDDILKVWVNYTHYEE